MKNLLGLIGFGMLTAVLLVGCGGGGSAGNESAPVTTITPVTKTLVTIGKDSQTIQLAFDRNGCLENLATNPCVKQSNIAWIGFTSDSVGSGNNSAAKVSGSAIDKSRVATIPNTFEGDRGAWFVIISNDLPTWVGRFDYFFNYDQIQCQPVTCIEVMLEYGALLMQPGDFKPMNISFGAGGISVTWDTETAIWGFLDASGKNPKVYPASEVQLIRWQSDAVGWGKNSTALGAISKTPDGKNRVTIHYVPTKNESGNFTAELTDGTLVWLNLGNRGFRCDGCNILRAGTPRTPAPSDKPDQIVAL